MINSLFIKYSMLSRQMLAMCCMVLSMISYQLSASFAKYLFQVLDPTSVVVFRLSFAAILLCLFLRSWRVIRHLPQVHWRSLLLYSISLGIMNILFYHALVQLPQGIAVGLEFVGPLGVALFAIRQRNDAIWVVCAILGVMLLMPWLQHGGHISWQGTLFALGAGLFWALYISFGKQVVRHNAVIGLHSLTLGIGLAAVMWMPYGMWNNAAGLFNVHYWGYAVGLAFLATVIPYALDMYAFKYLSKLSYGTFTSLAPALAALTGIVLLDEHLSAIQWLALCLIMIASIGVTVSTYLQSRHHDTAPTDKTADKQAMAS